MTAFFRFPHTPHLAWLGREPPRQDKVLSAAEVRALLDVEVIVEEKVDGANLGISVDDRASLQLQNRGSYLDLATAHPQWRPLRRWLADRQAVLAEALFPDLILFGEWCFATHSVHYDRLPDWFLAFDVYDRARKRFFSASRRDSLIRELGLAAVPQLGTGTFTLAELRGLLLHSRIAEGPAEGLYVRRDEGDWNVARAKLVRAEFTQAIEDHWSRGPLRKNELLRR